MAKTTRAGYKEIGRYRNYKLHEYIRKDKKKPRFIALSFNLLSIPDGELMAEDNNSVVDLKIKIRESELGSWGPGYLTGYPFMAKGSEEEKYMGIIFGKYTERQYSTHLPKFGARIVLDQDPWMVVLEGDTVAEMRKKIREYKKGEI